MNPQQYSEAVEFPVLFFAGVGCPAGQSIALLDDTALPSIWKKSRTRARLSKRIISPCPAGRRVAIFRLERQHDLQNSGVQRSKNQGVAIRRIAGRFLALAHTQIMHAGR